MRRLSVVIALALVATLMLPATAFAAPAASGGFWHQVRPGETVFAIGRLYGVSPYAIASANALPNWNRIYAGQWLWIPTGGYGSPGYGCARSHYVSPGETLLGIARWYGVSPWSIAAANGIYNLNRIYAGQWLCIP
jgi:LysM repeat protein